MDGIDIGLTVGSSLIGLYVTTIIGGVLYYAFIRPEAAGANTDDQPVVRAWDTAMAFCLIIGVIISMVFGTAMLSK